MNKDYKRFFFIIKNLSWNGKIGVDDANKEPLFLGVYECVLKFEHHIISHTYIILCCVLRLVL